MAINIQGNLNSVNKLANLLGINDWEIQTAKFAGVSFFIVPSSWEKIGALSTAFKVGNNLLNNSNDNSSLALGTSLAMESVKDMQTKKLAIYQLPNYDGYVINDQGNNGGVYETVGLFVGEDYLTAINNFRNAALAQSSTGYEFIHPVYGALQNCYCLSVSATFKYDKWKAGFINIKIIQAGSLSIKNKKKSIAQIISQTLSAINTLYNDINNIPSLILLATSTIGDVFKNNNNKSNPFKIAQSISISSSNTAQALKAATTLVYQQKLATQITNFNFANNTVDYNNLPQIYRYATIQTNQFANLLQYYSNIVNQTIAIYEINNLDVIFNVDILNLRNSITQLDLLLKSILSQIEQTYTSYTTVFNMSYRTLFFINNLDFNDQTLVTNFINSNINKLNDLNFIPKNTTLTLPKGA